MPNDWCVAFANGNLLHEGGRDKGFLSEEHICRISQSLTKKVGSPMSTQKPGSIFINFSILDSCTFVNNTSSRSLHSG